jgi:RNA polymerase sigma-70 factor (ECF subfamily)
MLLCDYLQGNNMSDFPETSHSLIERVHDSANGAAWAEFLGIYQPVVYRMARRRGLQDADALDVVQQVFASIARSIDTWKGGEHRPPFRAWLTTVARNAITNALTRRPRDRAAGSTSVIHQLNSVPAPEETTSEIIREARREMVHWAAQQIREEYTEQTWEIFWKTSIDGIAAAEVSESTGRSVGAIYVARHRVLVRLKEKVAELSQHWDTSDLNANDEFRGGNLK